MQRRQFTGALGAIVAGTGFSAYAQKSLGVDSSNAVSARLKALERESGGRLGVSVLDTANGARWGHRAGERFPMCSTFKLLAAALVLHRVDAGQEQLARKVIVKASDIITHSPTTKQYVGPQGITIAQLCEATITLSDNAAANLLLATFGGPQGLTAYTRSLGDTMTRLDRNEPSLNEATTGDKRDTTTPDAMVTTIQKIALGTVLSEASRKQITQWLLDNKTGDNRLRALLPAGWRVGDKTGTGGHGSTNDVGILWPPGRAPLVVAAYLTGTSRPIAQREAVLAKVGELAASLVA
ncbi:beta-lactamase class A [Polaromonas sp. YR568]|uniref:class A beta-lactamase n=1 Tax=Polaromonas sp. YR568 TaxID=1855301 RepID=UPI0008E544A6|nr:class A beta-lactamase [Polaromonas sp. YR568]SFU56106.1 beta-lactamase class A [Polaromonas sp. YR568]